MIPKHEFLRHYPWLINQFGPLKHLWTLRFESKHQFFKNFVKHLKNFKNILQTLAIKHQYKQAALSANGNSFVISNKVIPFLSDAYECYIAKMIEESFPNQLNEQKFISEKLNFHGIDYAKNMTICIGKNEVDNFVLCEISFMVINATFTNIAFFGKMKEIVLNSNLGVYEIDDRNDETITKSFSYTSLLSPDLILQIEIADIKVYVPKYVPLDPDYYCE